MAILTSEAPPAPGQGGPPAGGRHPKRWVVGVLAGVAVIALVTGLLVVTAGTGTESPPETTAPETSTTTPPTTVPPVVPGGPTAAVFPTPASAMRFDHPVAAARAFAVDFVGFEDPVVAGFSPSGADTGSVQLRATATGPVTTVGLQRSTGSWWVLGSSTPDIRLDAPAASASIASPVRLRGISSAFEAQVNAEVRQDGVRPPIGAGHLMGGSMGQMATFDGSVPFGPPSAARGALVLFTVSMQSGNVYEATVVPVTFAPPTPLVPATACPGYAMTRPAAPAGDMVVTVFYSCNVDAGPIPTYRVVPVTSGVLHAALDQLLAGPTAPERAAGLTSWFSSATAGYVRGVTVRAGTATVDFGDLRPLIPNASTSAGSRLLLSQLDATVTQFPTVTSVLYRIDGSCQAFGEWLQLDACTPRVPYTTTSP